MNNRFYRFAFCFTAEGSRRSVQAAKRLARIMLAPVLIVLHLQGCSSYPEIEYGQYYWSNYKAYVAGAPDNDASAPKNLKIIYVQHGEKEDILKGIARKEDDKTLLLVAPVYKRLIPLSTRYALAYRSIDDTDHMFLVDIESASEHEVPVPDGFNSAETHWAKFQQFYWEWEKEGAARTHVRIWLAIRGKNEGEYDVMLLDQDGTARKVVTGLRPVAEWADEPFRAIGEHFMTVFSSDDSGNETSYTYTLDGQLLGGPFHPIAGFGRIDTRETEEYDVKVLEIEPAMIIGELPNTPNPDWDHKGMGIYPHMPLKPTPEDLAAKKRMAYWDPHIYAPVSKDGLPIQLPKGVIGLMRLVTHCPNLDFKYRTEAYVNHPEGLHSGWAVLYSTADGKRQFGFAFGSMEDALAQSPKLTRYDAWEQANLNQSETFVKTLRFARIFARRANDGIWEVLDIETMKTYGSRKRGLVFARENPNEGKDLRLVKVTEYDFHDTLNLYKERARQAKEYEERQARLEAERRERERLRLERIEETYRFIADGDQYLADRYLHQFDLGKGENGLWVAYYRRFGVRDQYELWHARDAGMDQETLYAMEQELIRQQNEIIAQEQARLAREAEEAAWASALRSSLRPTYEHVEVEHLPGGWVRVRRYQKPLY